MKTELFKPTDVVVPTDRRAVNAERVEEIAESIGRFGLLHPPEVRIVDGKPVLVHGAHRIEALIKCGKGDEPIPMTVAERSDMDAAFVELIENLHRSDLTIFEKDEANKRVVDLIKASTPETVSDKGGRGKKGAHSIAADMTGQDKATIHASVNRIEKIDSELWAVLKRYRPNTTRDELEIIAKHYDAEKQRKLRKKLEAGEDVVIKAPTPAPVADEPAATPQFDKVKWTAKIEAFLDAAPDDAVRIEWLERALEAVKAKQSAPVKEAA